VYLLTIYGNGFSDTENAVKREVKASVRSNASDFAEAGNDSYGRKNVMHVIV